MEGAGRALNQGSHPVSGFIGDLIAVRVDGVRLQASGGMADGICDSVAVWVDGIGLDDDISPESRGSSQQERNQAGFEGGANAHASQLNQMGKAVNLDGSKNGVGNHERGI